MAELLQQVEVAWKERGSCGRHRGIVRGFTLRIQMLPEDIWEQDLPCNVWFKGSIATQISRETGSWL